ncbi:MAG: NTP transferase domain-containing protein, partial [Alphaproteobacteria bacterium]|nr:NTP transferase domain-containing protein [Alphaproteobacteria bacterium]
LAKVLHKIAGRPMINHLLATLDSAGIGKTVVVVAPEADDVANAVAPHKTAVQAEPLGTAHAVSAAYPELKDFGGDLMILYGDVPLISVETLRTMHQKRTEGADLVLLGFTPEDCAAYGRIITLSDGSVAKIVEFADASEEEKAVKVCNSGLMCGDAQKIFSWLKEVKPNNAKGEYYLTDIVEIARKNGAKIGLSFGKEEELLGVNTREELARAEKVVQARLRHNSLSEDISVSSFLLRHRGRT